MKRRVAGFAAAVVLLALSGRAQERVRATSADVELVEYEVVLAGGTNKPAATLQSIAAAAGGFATNIDGSSGRGIITLPRSRVSSLSSDGRLGSVKEAPPGASGRRIVHLQPVGNVAPPWSRTYSYDGAGNILSIGGDSFAYDGVSRLTSATVNGNVQAYTYDAFGNLLSASQLAGKCVGGKDCTVNRNVETRTNRIMASMATNTDCGDPGNAGTCYDAAGNLATLDSTHSFTWDALSVMTSRSDGGEQFLYDASDERIGTYAGGIWSWTIRDIGNHVLSEYSSSGTTGATTWTWQRDHIYRGPALVAATTRTGSTFHYHLDHLGTPRLVTSGGVEMAFHTYLPFGGELSTAPVESPKETLKFTGHEFDDLGSVYSTYYMHARSCSPTMGRFLSVDAHRGHSERPQSWNRYAYTQNNPLKAIDPDGKETQLIVGNQTNSNLFGHVAIAINGRVYSYGTQYTSKTGSKDWGGSEAKYLDAQKNQRSSEVITLKISPQQEQKLQQDLESHNPNASDAPKYSVVSNSCVTVIDNALIRSGTIPPPQSQNAMTGDLKPPGTTYSLLPEGVVQNVGNAGLIGNVQTVGNDAQPGAFDILMDVVRSIPPIY